MPSPATANGNPHNRQLGGEQFVGAAAGPGDADLLGARDGSSSMRAAIRQGGGRTGSERTSAHGNDARLDVTVRELF
jgi:hypothetical protein